jgi:hypothetical protein
VQECIHRPPARLPAGRLPTYACAPARKAARHGQAYQRNLPPRRLESVGWCILWWWGGGYFGANRAILEGGTTLLGHLPTDYGTGLNCKPRHLTRYRFQEETAEKEFELDPLLLLPRRSSSFEQLEKEMTSNEVFVFSFALLFRHRFGIPGYHRRFLVALLPTVVIRKNMALFW